MEVPVYVYVSVRVGPCLLPLCPLSSSRLPLFPSEENGSIPGVGVEKLLEIGKLDRLKCGPLFWVDSAESHPRIGKGDN